MRLLNITAGQASNVSEWDESTLDGFLIHIEIGPLAAELWLTKKRRPKARAS